MKKIIGILAILCLGAMLFATPFATSLLYDTSFGTFATPIDYASEAGREFFELDKTYIFGGLSNLNETSTISTTTNAFGVDTLLGIKLGTYIHNEKLPWSLFLNLYHDSTLWRMSSKTQTPTISTKPGVGADLFDWTSILVEEKTPGSLGQNIDDQIQFLTKYRDMVFGLKLGLTYADRRVAALNYKKTTTNYYDTAAATIKPNPAVDYTVDDSLKTNDNDFSLSLTSPVFIPGDRVDQTILAKIVFGVENDWTKKRKEIVSHPANTLGTFVNTIQDDRTQKTGLFGIGGSYKQNLNSPFLKGNSKDFYFSGSLDLTFKFPKDKSIKETQEYIYAAPGITKTTSEYAYESTDKKIALNLDLTLAGSVGHRFEFDLGKGVALRFEPSAKIELATRSLNGRLLESKNVKKVDTNKDGVVDSTITTTTTYSGVDASGTTNATNEMVVQLALSPSSALHYQPKNWSVGFTLGTKVDLNMAYILTTTKPGESTEIETTVTGPVTTTKTTTTLVGLPFDKTRNEIAWTATLSHSLSMNWDISENASLYADLGLTVGSGIFDLGNLRVQAIISLP